MGVPTLGCRCAVCTSPDPRNRRTRPSIAITWKDDGRERLVLIDTGPDFRDQALRAGIRHVDAVFYTHAHADHILGLDDLRPLSFEHKPASLPLYVDEQTAAILRRVFDTRFPKTQPIRREPASSCETWKVRRQQRCTEPTFSACR